MCKISFTIFPSIDRVFRGILCAGSRLSNGRLSNGLAEGIEAGAPYQIMNAFDCSGDKDICKQRCPKYCFSCSCDPTSKTCRFQC